MKSVIKFYLYPNLTGMTEVSTGTTDRHESTRGRRWHLPAAVRVRV